MSTTLPFNFSCSVCSAATEMPAMAKNTANSKDSKKNASDHIFLHLTHILSALTLKQNMINHRAALFYFFVRTNYLIKNNSQPLPSNQHKNHRQKYANYQTDIKKANKKKANKHYYLSQIIF